MNKNDIYSVFSDTDPQLLKETVESITTGKRLEIIKAPRTATVMMGVRDSVKQVPFYLGEVLISQCAVNLGGYIGYGFCLGDNPEKALYLAVFEAAVNSGDKSVALIEACFSEAARRKEAKERLEYAVSQKTRVKFHSMEEES